LQGAQFPQHGGSAFHDQRRQLYFYLRAASLKRWQFREFKDSGRAFGVFGNHLRFVRGPLTQQ
jgi:hypothetical protein